METIGRLQLLLSTLLFFFLVAVLLAPPKKGIFLLIRLMDKILHDLKDSKLWELYYIPYNGSCRILSINRSC